MAQIAERCEHQHHLNDARTKRVTETIDTNIDQRFGCALLRHGYRRVEQLVSRAEQ
jgi:hypothetical protein